MNNNKYCEPEGNTLERDFQLVRSLRKLIRATFPRKQLFCRMSSTVGLATTVQTRRVLTRAGGTSDRIV